MSYMSDRSVRMAEAGISPAGRTAKAITYEASRAALAGIIRDHIKGKHDEQRNHICPRCNEGR